MKHKKILSGIAMVSIFFTGCSYKSSQSGLSKVGYEETPLGNNKYALTYYGSGFHSEEDVLKLWRKRAKELCANNTYEADPKSDEWIFDSYTVLPPIFFKSKAAAPRVTGELQCHVSGK